MIGRNKYKAKDCEILRATTLLREATLSASSGARLREGTAPVIGAHLRDTTGEGN